MSSTIEVGNLDDITESSNILTTEGGFGTKNESSSTEMFEFQTTTEYFSTTEEITNNINEFQTEDNFENTTNNSNIDFSTEPSTATEMTSDFNLNDSTVRELDSLGPLEMTTLRSNLTDRPDSICSDSNCTVSEACPNGLCKSCPRGSTRKDCQRGIHQ
jgi:hypothetical protein